jgi:hypothetical protein
MTKLGTITIGNIRSQSNVPNAVAVRVDRTSGSPLGNPFHMRGEWERQMVCLKYEAWFREQLEKGNQAVLNELNRLKQIVRDGNNLMLLCWCSPKQCHAETIKAWLESGLAKK